MVDSVNMRLMVMMFIDCRLSLETVVVVIFVDTVQLHTVSGVLFLPAGQGIICMLAQAPLPQPLPQTGRSSQQIVVFVCHWPVYW